MYSLQWKYWCASTCTPQDAHTRTHTRTHTRLSHARTRAHGRAFFALRANSSRVEIKDRRSVATDVRRFPLLRASVRYDTHTRAVGISVCIRTPTRTCEHERYARFCGRQAEQNPCEQEAAAARRRKRNTCEHSGSACRRHPHISCCSRSTAAAVGPEAAAVDIISSCRCGPEAAAEVHQKLLILAQVKAHELGLGSRFAYKRNQKEADVT